MQNPFLSSTCCTIDCVSGTREKVHETKNMCRFVLVKYDSKIQLVNLASLHAANHWSHLSLWSENITEIPRYVILCVCVCVCVCVKESVIVPIYNKGDKTECNNYRGISILPTTYKIFSNILLSRLIPYAEKIMGIINVDSDAIGQLLITSSVFVKYFRKNGNTMRQCISSL